MAGAGIAKPKYFILYETKCLINGKVYIGKHVTTNAEDEYLGSGKFLRVAINKYGVESFERRIIATYDNENQLNAAEAEVSAEKNYKVPTQICIL